MKRNRSEIFEKILMAPRNKREAALDAAEAALAGEQDLVLVKQATAARMLDCSRFTIRRLVADDVLHPVNLRGLVRYKVAELRKISGEVA